MANDSIPPTVVSPRSPAGGSLDPKRPRVADQTETKQKSAPQLKLPHPWPNSGPLAPEANESATARRAWPLVDILRSLPPRELTALIERLGVKIDEAKRIDVASQVARVIVSLPEARDSSHLSGQAREVVHRVAEAGGVLQLTVLPNAVPQLAARGILFARGLAQGGVELILPIALLIQLRPWEAEDPRGLRGLLTQISPEVAASIASYYLGRSATQPFSLALETAWIALSDAERLRAEVASLAPLERKLLVAIEEIGGEVDTAELLDLEREPLRLRGATGATPSRRGVGFALERRGFLIPIHPNRHVVPSEVALLVGAQKQKEREARRREIRQFVLGDDHAPHRASFSCDPAALALAMALTVREFGVDVRANVGIPRTLLGKIAARLGQDQDTVSLLATLSRSVGLWDSSAVSESSPPGALRLSELTQALFQAWSRGGAWDEAHPEGEVLRLGGDSKEGSVVGVIRTMVLDALRELGDGRWVPWEAIAGYVRTDSRTPGLARLIERWASRIHFEPLSVAEIARRIAFESLHVLGVLDLGDADDDEHDDSLGPTLRVTARGKALLAWLPGQPSQTAQVSASQAPAVVKAKVVNPTVLKTGETGARETGAALVHSGRTERAVLEPAVLEPGVVEPRISNGAGLSRSEFVDGSEFVHGSEFVDGHTLRVGSSARVGAVLALAPFVEICAVAGVLDVAVSQAALSRALAAGIEAEWIAERLAALAPLPDPIARLLTQAGTVLGRADFVPANGFLWIDDPELLELLRSRRQHADLFVEPSPPGGLLIAAGVDFERLVRRCRVLGVEVTRDGEVYRTRSTVPPARRSNPPESVIAPRSSATKPGRNHRVLKTPSPKRSGRIGSG